MTILVDTSVWIAHFRSALPHFQELLFNQAVLIHPIVIGELATGNLKSRRQTLADLCALPRVEPVTFKEGLHFIEVRHLHGTGLGWNDVQLLASTQLASVRLWTLDGRLAKAAQKVDLDFAP